MSPSLTNYLLHAIFLGKCVGEEVFEGVGVIAEVFHLADGFGKLRLILVEQQP